jgi:hypothetical protein
MSEEPDTAKIRAAYVAVTGHADRALMRTATDVLVLDLCTALDTARAERDDERRWRVETYEKLVIEGRVKNQAIDRAEASGARIAELEQRLGVMPQILGQCAEDLVAAEDRIAAALEEHVPRSSYPMSLHPDDKMCRTCRTVYPCPTARALGAAELNSA